MQKSNKKILKQPLSLYILIYFIVFAVVLLLFLWIFQILCLNTYYKITRTNTLNNSVGNLIKAYESENYREKFDEIAAVNDICIEIVENNMIEYSSSTFGKKCITRNSRGLLQFQTEFIKSDENTSKVEIVNPSFNNKTLVIGKRIDNNTFLFVNTSLVPLDESIKILKKQFLFIAVSILFMSSIVSYFISKRLSIPIININNKAKLVGKKKYDVVFDENTRLLEIDELSSTLNSTTKELAKTDELRRELMANVSHDLKTPLTLIRAYAEAARDIDANKKEKRNEDLSVIVEETERLTLLVNDILELSKLESNIIELDYTEFNLCDLITGLVKKFDILKSDGFLFNINCEKNIIVKSDRRKLEQVIYNLLNNAINYTGNDKVVTINVINRNNSIRVEIIDTGSGIPEENINLIWDKYYKIDKQHKRNKYGTGLGLSIVKSILIGLKYDYGVESEIGKGTKFYFEIK